MHVAQAIRSTIPSSCDLPLVNPPQWSALHFCVDMHAHDALVFLLQGATIHVNTSPPSLRMLCDPLFQTLVSTSPAPTVSAGALQTWRGIWATWTRFSC